MSSIPLPALSIRQPEQPSALDQYARIMAVKQQQALMPGQLQQQQQQIQATGLENQQREQGLKDQQAMTQAYQKWDGKDPKQLAQMVTDSGGSASARTTVEQHFLGIQKAYSDIAKTDSETGQNNLNILKQKNDTVLGAINAASSVPDDQLGPRLAQTVQGLQQQGMLDQQHAQAAGQLIQGLQGGQIDPATARQQIDLFKKGLQSNSAQLDEAAKTAEAAKNNAQAGKDTAETDLIKKFGGTSVDAQQQADWINKNPGKGPSDFMAYKAGLAPKINFSLQNSGTTGNAADVAKKFGMTPASFDQAAEKFNTTGQLPPVGRGGANVALNKAIMNRSADLHPGESLAANAGAYKANQDSLKKIQSNFDNVSAFENTAIKNLDQVAQAAAAVPDLGTRFATIPVRMISSQMLGTPEMARFKTALLTAQTESAKILGSSNASGVLSDSARHEAQEVLDGNLPFPAMMASINQLKTDFANRHQAYADQIQAIKGRMGNSSQNPPPSAAATHRYNPATQKIEEIK